MSYYDGTKILSLTDINGNKPEIYLITTNRSGGKTTYFGRLAVNRFFKYKQKFALLYRFKYELTDIHEKFFKDIGELFFPNYTMIDKTRQKGCYSELFLIDNNKPDDDPISVGYALAINCADGIKKFSHFFSDVGMIIFDEFQSETNHYCNDEINKFQSIHTSIARGKGKQRRYVPVFMLSNPVSLLNPYYSKLNISSRLTSETKFLRGDGYVLEQGFVKSASDALLDSGFYRAFNSKEDNYTNYATQGIYLLDSNSFIEKPKGNNRYFVTFKYKGSEYGVRIYDDLGIIYCDDKPDTTYKNKIAVTTDDFSINYVTLNYNIEVIIQLRYYFNKGCFRFKNLQAKECILAALSIK